MVLGFILAVVVSVLFAVYAVPRKFSKSNVILYTMWMGIAYFTGTLLIIGIMRGFGWWGSEDLFSSWHLVTLARGLIWVLGMAAYNLAIDKIGLARFNQWKNFQGPVGSLLMLTLLPEVVGMQVVWLVLGMFIIFISAMLFTIKPDGEQAQKATRSGICCALFAALCFGVAAFLNKIVSNQGFLYAQLFYHSLSLIVFSAIAYAVTSKGRIKGIFAVDKKTWLPFMAGAMYTVASILTILSYGLIAGPVSWSITQLNAVWTILIGIFIFKEVSIKRHWLRISAGFVTALAACVLLFFAM